MKISINSVELTKQIEVFKKYKDDTFCHIMSELNSFNYEYHEGKFGGLDVEIPEYNININMKIEDDAQTITTTHTIEAGYRSKCSDKQSGFGGSMIATSDSFERSLQIFKDKLKKLMERHVKDEKRYNKGEI